MPSKSDTGSASQVSDGAAAVVLARRSVAQRLGLPIVGKFVTSAVVGVPPRIMGVGPAYAIPKVLEKTGLSKDDVDFFEINEAFASQAVYSIQKVGLSFDKVNINGGAIAIGHPLGCSTCHITFAYRLCLDVFLSQREHVKLLLVSTLRNNVMSECSSLACVLAQEWAWPLWLSANIEIFSISIIISSTYVSHTRFRSQETVIQIAGRSRSSVHSRMSLATSSNSHGDQSKDIYMMF